MNEFAIAGSDNLLTGNPFDTELRPGTSSAGSAAAVSDYQCHVAIGSQTVRVNKSNGKTAEWSRELRSLALLVTVEFSGSNLRKYFIQSR